MKRINCAPLAVGLYLLCLCFGATAAAPSSTDEARLLAALRKAHPATHFTSASHTPIPGLFEVWMGPNVAFVSDKNLRYLVFGRLFDAQTMTDLTAPKLARAERLQAQAEDRDTPPVLPIAQLPLTDAIKTVHGNGGDASRHVVVFSDPACPYCKRLEPELDKLDNVTIYTFLVPFQGTVLPTAIWCAPDRQQAWRRAMVDSDRNSLAESAASPAPASSTLTTSCAPPLDRNLALAQQLKIHGTPTLFYANARRTDGYADAAEIEAQMNAGPKTDPTRAPSGAHAIAPHQQEPTP